MIHSCRRRLLWFLLLLWSHSRGCIAHESCCKYKLGELGDDIPEFIVDPDDNDPPRVDSNGNKRWIPDPNDVRPDYWDEEDDGPWAPRELLNPEYNWTPRMIPNPRYVPPPTYWDKLSVETNAALPWVTLGILLTGCINLVFSLLPTSKDGLLFALLKVPSQKQQQEQQSILSIGLASILGLATPLCSCGALPLAASFVTSGIPLSTTVAFLTASQSAGLDSAAITWGLLGPTAVLCRLAGAIVLAMAAGLMCGVLYSSTRSAEKSGSSLEHKKSDDGGAAASTTSGSCCAPTLDASPKPNPNGNSETGHSTTATSPLSIVSHFWVTLSDTAVEILPTVLAGLALSTGALHFFPTMSTYYSGESFLVRTVLLVTSMPMQLCEHTTVTLAAAIQKAGGSPGLSFAFLMAAPSTNMSTLLWLMQYGGTVWSCVGVILAITSAALIMSYIVDGLGLDLLVDKDTNNQMSELPSLFVSVVPYLVACLFCTGMIRQTKNYYFSFGTSAKSNASTQADCCATSEKAKND